jgi:hypothetical protein
MTGTRATIVAGLSALTLAASLGAGPATQPSRAAPGDAQHPSIVCWTQGIARLAQPADPAPFRDGSRIVIPPRVDVMPNASIYLTPRAQWSPRQFNEGTFYLIPCARAESATAAATVARLSTVVTRGTVTVDWGKLLARPSTQPTSAAAP